VPAEVRLLPRAERELRDLSQSLQDQILAKLDLLTEFPELGAPMLAEWRSRGRARWRLDLSAVD
jgi:mRNA-degrading endonuclease RelE of RelBE toxin-antitoxin system